MPRYFFEIHNNGISRDDEGIELADIEAVRAEAMQCLPQIAAHEIPNGTDWQHFSVVVTDEIGRTVYTATIAYTGVKPER